MTGRPLEGIRVLAFESRRAEELRRLLVRHGADYRSAPALREIPMEENPEALAFADELVAGRVDVVILLTGVGTRALFDATATRYPTEELARALSRTTIVARGPKPVAALRSVGLQADFRAPEPNTWRELLAVIDDGVDVRGRAVAVQEYGRPNRALLGGLEERGARIRRVPVYRWALPEDTGPLTEAARDLRSASTDVVVFTTAVQLDHLFQITDEKDHGALSASLRDDVVIAAVGPTVVEALADRGLPADIVPEHPKLGYLAAAIAEQAGALVRARGRR